MSMMPGEAISVEFDREIFLTQLRGGVSRYFASLIAEFATDPVHGVRPTCRFRRSVNRHVLDSDSSVRPLPAQALACSVAKIAMRSPSQALREGVLTMLGGPAAAVKSGDILHLTHFQPRRSDLAASRHLAMTVHDMIPESRPADWRGWNPHEGKGALLRRASVVFSVSATTSRLLCERFGVPACPLVTAPHGVAHDVFHPARAGESSQSPIDFPYILFVGKRTRYKNFDRLLAALRSIRAGGLDVGVVAVGGGGITRHERSRVADSTGASRFRHLTPDDGELADLYRFAETFCFPSEAEGFGLPALEAMACGCPTVLADIPVFREVAGDAALFSDPRDAESLAQALRAVIQDRTLRQSLVSRGVEHSAGYTWQQTAAAVAKGYRLAMT